jgi:hypothetical protein
VTASGEPAPPIGEPSGSPDDPTPDGTGAQLARDVYWASEGVPRSDADARSLRGRLDAFSEQLHREHRQVIPYGDPALGSPTGWKRAAKVGIWRLTRFSTRRYDRLLADLADLTAELAARLQASEDELARLREERAEREANDG